MSLISRPSKYFTNEKRQRVSTIQSIADEINNSVYEVKIINKTALQTVAYSKFCKKRFYMDLLNDRKLYKAILFDEIAEKFFMEFEEKQTYQISHIQIKPKNYMYNNFSSEYEVVFTNNTNVEKKNVSSLDEDTFDINSLIEYTKISKLGGVLHKSLVNIKNIRILVVGEVESFISKGIIRKKQEILITDSSNIGIPLVLWENNLNLFEFKEGDILIIQNIRIMKFKNYISLWKTFSTKFIKIDE